MATEIISVIDPDSGAGFDYASLASWESDKAGDITLATGSDEIQTAKCRCTGGTADTTGVALSASWKTAATEYIKVWTDTAEGYRHDGTYQTGNVYRIEQAGSAISSYDNANHVAIIGLEFLLNGTASGQNVIDFETDADGWVYVEQCIFKETSSGSSNVAVRINRSGFDLRCSNNVIYDFDGTGTGVRLVSGISRLSNNTIHNCGRGIYKTSDTNNDVYLYNNLVQDCITNDFDNNSTDWEGENYNVTSDGNDISGANSVTGDATFWDKANDDFHLHHDDTVARAAGTDLSSDTYPFSVDMDGDTRVDWDIGADESPTDVVSIVDPNGTGDYTSLANWAADKDADIVAAHQIQIAKCICSGGTKDSTSVTMSATWATDEKHFIKIWTDPAQAYRHNGTYQTGNKYRLEIANGNGIVIGYNIPADDIYIIGLQIKLTETWAVSKHGITISGTGAGKVYIEQNVILAAISGTAHGNFGLNFTRAGKEYRISNNIIYDFIETSSNDCAGVVFNNGTHFCYNNTVHNCEVGFKKTGAGADVTLRNCAAQDCDDGFDDTVEAWDDADYCCSDISSDAPGGNSVTGDVTFEDEDGDDFHLADADTLCRGAGVDLSADPDYAIIFDIDGDTRSFWDIGADENLAVGGVTHEGSATATGTGSSSAAGSVIRGGSATATGAGSTAAAGSVIRGGSATAIGSGASSAAGSVIRGGSATATGSGSTAAAGSVIRGGSATATGVGSIAAAGTIQGQLPPLAIHSATRTLAPIDDATRTITPVDQATLTLGGIDEATRGARRN